MTNTFLKFLLCGLAAFGQAVPAPGGLRHEPPVIGFFHPLSEGEPSPSILMLRRPAGLTLKTDLIEERQVIDFEQRAVSFDRVEKNFGIVIWQYRYDEMDAYLDNRQKFAFANLWYSTSLSILRMPPEKKKEFNIFQMELPVQYPSWAQRILGKEPPRLTITGYEKIEVAYDYTKIESEGSNLQTNGTGGPKFDQENQFTVNGSVGRLINVNIKASTNKMDEVSDPFKNFKIEYKGEGNELEDEVVQEVTAGYMGFSMPGANLAGYSNSHEGLIGIQVKSRIGPLELTTIASQEHGESQKASFDLSAGGGGVTTITEKDFLRNKMFFLDTAYLSMYLGKRKTAPDISKLKVFISNSKTAAEFSSTQKSTSKFYKTTVDGVKDITFKLLVPERDYTIDKQINGGKGCLRFLDSIQVQDEDNIGIYLAVSDTTVIPIKGDTTVSKGDTSKTGGNSADTIKNLWILKKSTMPPDDPNFRLMFRNVYALPYEIDPANFKIKVRMVPTAGGETLDVVKESGLLFSSVLGLVDQNNSAKITSNEIFDIADKLLIIPPFKDTGIGNEPFANPALGTNNTNPEIYNTVGEKFNSDTKSKYSITMTGSSRKTSFQLGTGSIIPGTVKVKGDGEDLVNDVDYSVDNQFGTLALISKKALAKTRIDVEYQSEALFVPKSKVFLGVHGEMKLPFGMNSFVGASVLYQDAASQEAVPKIGQEPYQKVLLDVNTKMDFEPQWMTDAVNLIPLLSSDAKSTANFEMEVAHSRTNPNTKRDAYIDDFESSNKPYTLGRWYQAAPPRYLLIDSLGNPTDSLLKCPPGWFSYWYQPQGDARLYIDSIHTPPKIKITSTDQKYEQDMLNLECLPAPNKSPVYINPSLTLKPNPLADDSAHQFIKPWAGIMYPFPISTIDRTKDKYFEFWARGDCGRLFVDMGELSEDICFEGGRPDGKPHDEDTAHLGTIDSSEDVGLDGFRDKDEFYLVPNSIANSWDTLKYGNESLPFATDPSHDNFQTYGDASQYKYNFPYNNGTEKDAVLTSKDLNGDGLSNATTEKYFRRVIDFDSLKNAGFMAINDNNYMVPDAVSGAKEEHGWHLYRIPLNDTIKGKVEKYGSPRWDRIKYIRLFWTNFNPDRKKMLNKIQFAGMQIVRNEWQEAPAISDDSTQRIIKLQSSSINTYDNSDVYIPPPGIPNTTDDQGNQVKETSLRLNYTDVRAGETALVRDILIGQSINISSYQSMNMWIYSDREYVSNADTVRFFFRFGADDYTYYEYNTPISKGWSPMNIDLHELSKFKQNILGASMPDSIDIIINSFGLKYRNKSPPNFSNITWMALGIRRGKSATNTSQGISGELWVDELKVGGVHQFNGWAGRASLSTSWAGFMDLGGSVEYHDGDFQKMTETEMKLGATSLTEGLNARWTLSRFLPTQWGVTVPFGTSINSSISRPSLVPNTDEYLTGKNNKPDDISDMYRDAINLIAGGDVVSGNESEAKHFQTTSVTKSYYTSYDKSYTSKNPIVNLLLERLSLDYKSSYSLSQNAKGSRNDQSGLDIIDSLTSQDYNGNIKYDLSPKPAPDWTKWKPFGKMSLQWLPDRIKNYELSLLPATLNFNVANIDYRTTEDKKESQNTHISTKNLTLSHSGNFAWDPINILNLNYSLNINRNLDNFVNSPAWSALKNYDDLIKLIHQIRKPDDTWKKYFILNGERDRTQTSSIKLDPTIWDWLSMSTDYSANFKQSAATLANDATQYANMGVDSKYHLTTTLTLTNLFKNLSDALPNATAVKTVFGSIEKALNKISLNSFSMNYDASLSLVNNNMDRTYCDISRADMLQYQLGFLGRTGKDIVTGTRKDSQFGGMKSRNRYGGAGNADVIGGLDSRTTSDKQTTTRSFSVNSGFNLPEPISISIGTLGLKWSKSFSSQPDPKTKDSSTIFPNFDIGGSTQMLNKIGFVTRFLQSVSLTSSYNYQFKITKTYTPNSYDSIATTAYRFAPLVGLDGKLKKWPWNLTYSHTWNASSETKLSAGKTETVEHSNKIGATYELQKSSTVSEFKLLLWTIPLKGTFSLGVEGELGSTANITQISKDASEQSVNTSSISFTPHTSYTFSDNITGEAHYSYSQKKERSQSTTSHIFALSVTVNLK